MLPAYDPYEKKSPPVNKNIIELEKWDKINIWRKTTSEHGPEGKTASKEIKRETSSPFEWLRITFIFSFDQITSLGWILIL